MNPLKRYHYNRSFLWSITINHSSPIKRSCNRFKGFVRSGRPDRLPKYSFVRSSFPLTQDEFVLDSVVAGLEPTAAKPESFFPVTPLRVVTSEVKLILPIGNQSFVPGFYSVPPSFAGYPLVGYLPFPYPYMYLPSTINTDSHYAAFLVFLC
ncbi:hypothetical protein BOTCAL_1291g00010 [Botryotinia calthae]|uniref:Uncharacterized protein n=1 Tax=Botryotinia calthae TaxID=38488 RepID=A0A4Y8CCQ9_9HELO|nr:hypothetical protein BOTCAL_1291g00010 [Botryotinia calthae]